MNIGKDLTIAGRLNVKNFTAQNIINTTTNNYQLIVSEDLSLNGRLFVSGNVAIGGNITATPSYSTATSITPNTTDAVFTGFSKNGNFFDASASSNWDTTATFAAYNVFNGSLSDSKRWHCGPNKYTNGATNANTATTTITGGDLGVSSVTGEWIQIRTSPNKFRITQFTLATGANNLQFTRNFILLGSNDGTTWVAIQKGTSTGTTTSTGSYTTAPNAIVIGASSVAFPDNSTTTTLTNYDGANNSYYYFRLVTTSLVGSNTVVEIGEWTPTFAIQTDTLTLNSKNNIGTIFTGKVGIGTTNPNYPLGVFGRYDVSANTVSTFYGNSGANLSTNTTTGVYLGVSIYSEMAILSSNWIAAAQGTITASDKRIKENIVDVNKYDTIEMLRKLKPKHFNYIDRVNFGNQTQIGYIADEVFEINKDFIKYITQYIPNIYELANVSNNIITLNNKITSNLEKDASGNLFPKLKLYDASNNEILTSIVSTLDDKRIEISDKLNMNKVFVYGQEINNYKFLSYEYLNVVTTAAVQEIDTIVQKQQSTIETLQTENQEMNNEIQALKDQIASILTRLTVLENK